MSDKIVSYPLAGFFEERNVESVSTNRRKMVKVVIKPMTKEEARQIFSSRPYSKYAESRWGGNNLYDDVCMVLNELALRCKMCQAPTLKKYLTNDTCPDCDGRSEFAGIDPYRK